MTVRVRLASSDDHSPAVALWAASEAARRGAEAPAGVADRLRERFARPDVWLLVADDDGTVVGVTQGWPALEDDGAGQAVPGRCHLSLVFAAADRWGEGIGGRLVDAALGHARSLGYAVVQLYTHEDNVRAQRLYASRGFARDGLSKLDDWGEPIARWTRVL